jgi:hypothetical protein
MIEDTPEVRNYIADVINGTYVPSESDTIQFVQFLRFYKYSLNSSYHSPLLIR